MLDALRLIFSVTYPTLISALSKNARLFLMATTTNSGVTAATAQNIAKTSLQFDLLSMTVDLSDSTVTILQTTGYGTVTVSLADGSHQTTSFDWEKIGEFVQLSNPSTLESWLSNLPTTIVELDAEIPSMEVSSGSGSNTFSAEFQYDGIPFDGVSQSWYNSSSDRSGIYPDQQLCF